MGRLEIEKGAHILLKAAIGYVKASKTPDLGIIVAGDGSFRRVFLKASQARLLGYISYVDPSKLSELYCSAKAVILPSLTEGLPTVLLEAIFHGVPTIVLNEHLKDIVNYLNKFMKKRVDVRFFKDEKDLAKLLGEVAGH